MNFRVPPYARELVNLSEAPAEPVTEPAPEPPADPTPAPSETEPAPAPVPEPSPAPSEPAPEPGSVEVIVEEPAPATEPVLAVPPAHVHKIRLADALATVENFFARNPQLERALITDLSTGLSALERFL